MDWFLLRTSSYQSRGGLSPFLSLLRTHKPYRNREICLHHLIVLAYYRATKKRHASLMNAERRQKSMTRSRSKIGEHDELSTGAEQGCLGNDPRIRLPDRCHN